MIYEKSGFSEKGIGVERFKSDLKNSEELRQLIYDRYEFKSMMTFQKFKINLAIYLKDYDLVEEVHDGVYVVNVCGEERGSAGGGLKGGKWGIIDKFGSIVLPIEYDYIDYSSRDGMFYFVNELDWGYEFCGLLDKKGNRITEPVFEGHYDYVISDSFVWLKKGEYWGMINLKGEILYEFKYLVYEDRFNEPYVNEGYVNLGFSLLRYYLVRGGHIMRQYPGHILRQWGGHITRQLGGQLAAI